MASVPCRKNGDDPAETVIVRAYAFTAVPTVSVHQCEMAVLLGETNHLAMK